MIKFLKFIAILLFITAIFVVSAIGGYAYVVPKTFVSLNANTIIGYSVNIYDIVIDSSSSDEAGKNIICYANFNFKKITDAIPETIDELIAEGNISKDNKLNITITVNSSDKRKADNIAKKIEDSIQKYISGKPEIKNININVKLQ